MKTCKVFWYGESKSGNHYVGVEFLEGDFYVKRFVKVSGNTEYEAGQSIEVPEAALN
jgi:hypothetical protein